MFDTYLKCELIRQGDKPLVRTARGLLSYPAVFEPSSNTGDDGVTTLKYGTTHIYPVEADLTMLKEACYAVADAVFPNWKTKYPNLRMPWKNSTDKNLNGIPYYEKMGHDPVAFPTFIRCGSLESFGKPVVRNIKGEDLGKDQAEQLYPGRWARIVVGPYAYGKDAKAKNRGISLGFDGVMILEEGEPLTARRMPANQQFEAVSGDASDIFKETA